MANVIALTFMVDPNIEYILRTEQVFKIHVMGLFPSRERFNDFQRKGVKVTDAGNGNDAPIHPNT